LRGGGGGPVPVSDGPTVRKDERWPLVWSEFGEISAVKISDGKNGCYYLHFITMNPGSLFLPVYLHSEMVLYVNSEGHDVETCFGWSVIVTSKELDVLKDTNFGVFVVNLAKGSMMAPHFSPNTIEIAIVLHGQGVIEVVCPGIASETGCKNSRLRVEEGDVFVVPREHPMAQMSFNNDSFVFMGLMLNEKKESPQYLAGKLSILQRLDRKVLEKSFNVGNTTLDWILSNEKEDIIYECVSCAEEAQGGSGTLSWINVEKDDDKLQQVVLKHGDIFRLSTQTVFYLQNNVEAYQYQPQNLQIYAIFPGSEVQLQNDLIVGAYTAVHDLVLGFDN
ncbi:hypothetical protein M8C21_028699, partial [Ambrosia artemisiifolia]